MSSPTNMFSEMNLPSAKTLVSTAASVAASAMVIRAITQDIIPYEFQSYIFSSIRGYLKSFSSDVILIIEEHEGFLSNQIYRAAEIYLGTKVSPLTQMFIVSMPEKETKISTFMAKNQEILDIFNGVQFKWRQVTKTVENKRTMYPGQYSSNSTTESNCFELSFHKKHKKMVFDAYFPYLLKEFKNLKQKKKTLKLYTLSGNSLRSYAGQDYAWSSINLDHPATFDTLAMDMDMKKMIMEDLERFVKRKEYYRAVGKAWKRGYLLYGPPGTGKSSLIAAMANYLKFDIFDLELTDVHSNSELRRLLIATANRSILVVEDIDCSLDLDDRQTEAGVLNALRPNPSQTVNFINKNMPKVTLSGLLNFMDGLWSSCGDERIIVFTTNYKDRLDPALLRPGRMDVHIHMSYCTPCGFNILASNYLEITDDGHYLFPEIKHLLDKIMVTPAEVGEQLLKNEDPEIALKGLLDFLHRQVEASEARKLEKRETGKVVGNEKSVAKSPVQENGTLV